jgi:hypothetical protein
VTRKETVERPETAVYTVPTDAPEADGTLSWDSTTLVLATVRCGPVTGTGYTYAPAAAAHIIDDLLAEGRGVVGAVRGTRAAARRRGPCERRRRVSPVRGRQRRLQRQTGRPCRRRAGR